MFEYINLKKAMPLKSKRQVDNSLMLLTTLSVYRLAQLNSTIDSHTRSRSILRFYDVNPEYAPRKICLLHDS